MISVLVVMSAGLAVQIAAAGPQEDVAAAGQKWGTVFAEEQSRHHGAILCQGWRAVGTLFADGAIGSLRGEGLFRGRLPGVAKATVKFGDQLIRVYGDTAVNTGYYTFSYTKDGETKSIPARYSFTYVKDGNDWKIVDHHSSAMPAPPK